MIIERTRWVTVQDTRLTRLTEGKLVRIIVRKQPLAFVRMQGALRAMLDQCPHQGNPLSGGWVEDCHVVCPFHRFHYDPITGKSKHGSTANVPVYAVEETADGVRVGFPYTSISVFGYKLW
ncbi:MAG: Rieske (2Fe-2S) protein [Flavobacteriales bacterium]|nr:Rieske (2Fe-2S) protein [Flavobacteriales bacterium]MCC6937089.1 Rieske (2Fe-2S) protein [Flavobacteriales bacterium]